MLKKFLYSFADTILVWYTCILKTYATKCLFLVDIALTAVHVAILLYSF